MLHLPVDLLFVIVSRVTDSRDVRSLFRTCRFMWRLSRDRRLMSLWIITNKTSTCIKIAVGLHDSRLVSFMSAEMTNNVLYRPLSLEAHKAALIEAVKRGHCEMIKVVATKEPTVLDDLPPELCFTAGRWSHRNKRSVMSTLISLREDRMNGKRVRVLPAKHRRRRREERECNASNWA
jgi:hypothetical protein